MDRTGHGPETFDLALPTSLGDYECVKALKEWDRRLWPSTQDLSERYLDGLVELHVHLAAWWDGSARHFYCICATPARDRSGREFQGHSGRLGAEHDLPDGSSEAQFKQASMFVYTTQFIEDPQRMPQASVEVCSVARLINLEQRHCLRRDVRYFSGVLGVVGLVLGVGGVATADQEVALLREFVDVARRVGDRDQLGDKLIKARAQKEQDEAGSDAQIDRGRDWLRNREHELASSIRIEIGPSHVRVLPPEFGDGHIKVADVLLGPI